MYSLIIVTTYNLFQISSTLSPTSKNVCPEKLPPIDEYVFCIIQLFNHYLIVLFQFTCLFIAFHICFSLVRNISKDAFTVKCCPDFFEKDDICEHE